MPLASFTTSHLYSHSVVLLGSYSHTSPPPSPFGEVIDKSHEGNNIFIPSIQVKLHTYDPPSPFQFVCEMASLGLII